MKHVLTTAPAIEPVSLADMRAHLGITRSEDTSRDTIITARITAARQMAEFHTRQALIHQTWTAYATEFPAEIPLKSPLVSVSSVQYIDSNGALQTLAADQYSVDTINHCLVPAYGVSWPQTRIVPSAVRVAYVCGYGATAASVPQTIREAILFMVGQWEVFQNKITGDYNDIVRPMTIPNAAKQLLGPYIDYRDLP